MQLAVGCRAGLRFEKVARAGGQTRAPGTGRRTLLRSFLGRSPLLGIRCIVPCPSEEYPREASAAQEMLNDVMQCQEAVYTL